MGGRNTPDEHREWGGRAKRQGPKDISYYEI
jgi:hypothetical protein